MKNTHENLDAALKSFSKNHDRVKLLSESRELLDYFYTNTRSRPILFWLLIFGLVVFCITILIFSIIKNNKIAGLYDADLFILCATVSVLTFMMPATYLLLKQAKLSRMDDITIELCLKKNDWSVPALKASSKMISSIQGSLEKRLNTFKIICGGFAFIIVIFTNKAITTIPYLHHIINMISANVFFTDLSFFIICTAAVIIIYTYVEFCYLVFYINHCSKIKASIDFLISISEEDFSEQTKNK
ncbi:hypothetical protein QL467_002278 [Salmonella enterica]|nr:hypothetical protein [Salmonella enterica]EAM8742360.1 hypothetical protein [Salmonella enterica]EAQ8934109.1 hypothetical protein [Salmonella enterica]EAZ9079256.1 hypothetical protein [Salmonella enterica]EDQ5070617.1 hypothetical protein [Salmonella enterica]